MVDIVNRLRDTFEHWGLGSKGPSILKEAADEIAAIRSERDSLKALCNEMAKALEPFAKLASEFVDEEDFRHKPDDRTVWGFNDHELSYGDFRRIHSLLAAYRKEKEVGNG